MVQCCYHRAMIYARHIPVAAAVLAALATTPLPARAEPDAPRAVRLAEACRTPGIWIDAPSGSAASRNQFLDGLAAKPLVLLGEFHDSAEHHRWQLHTLAALHSRAPQMVIGFEMFPRHVQPVLDRWVKGELPEKAFLEAVEWQQVWGFDAALYMPLFDFARMHKIPMVALNVDRSLITRVAAEGWAAIPEDARRGIGTPVRASSAYRQSLARVFAMKEALKHGHGAAGGGKPEAGKPEPAKPGEAANVPEPPKLTMGEFMQIWARPKFQRFVEAQTVWDRAMAEGLADAKRAHPQALIAGIMGGGHVAHGYGVPYQLAGLGQHGSTVLMPIDAGDDCAKMPPDFADAVFTVEAPKPAADAEERPRLGVMLGAAENAVRVDSVMPGSVAEATKLQNGDLIVRAAGVETRKAADLTGIIARQAPGTWLPLTVRRGAEEIELIAKFPAPPARKP